MKKIKILIVLVFFLIISAVSSNVNAATNNLTNTDLIRIYNSNTGFEFTVTDKTKISDIIAVYGEPKIKTDSYFGGSAYTFYLGPNCEENNDAATFENYLYVETVANDEYIVSYGTVWNEFFVYKSGYDYTLNASNTDPMQGFIISDGSKIKGGVYYNRNRNIASDFTKTNNLVYPTFSENKTHYLYGISRHAVTMYKALSKSYGYKTNFNFDEDYFYINEQLKETGLSLREYITNMNKSNYMSAIGVKNSTKFATGNYYFVNPAMFADMLISKALNKKDRTGEETIAVFDYIEDRQIATAILVSPKIFKTVDSVKYTEREDKLYEDAVAEYNKAMSYFNTNGSTIYSTNPVISPASALNAGTLLENKKLGIVSYFNSIRIAAGLPTVQPSDDHFLVAQHMATLMSYRWNTLHLEITHSPSKPSGVSDTFFSTAIGEGRGYAENISRSASDTSVSTMKKYVNMFLDDKSETPMNFSHRSLLLNPKFNKFGFGISPNIGVIEINGAGATDVFLKAWPAEGVTFMETLDSDNFYWTAQFLSKYTLDKSTTKVTVECLNTKETWTFDTEENTSNRRYEIRTTYSSELNNMLVFYDSKIAPKDGYVYKVTITGLKDTNGNETSYSYRSVFRYADVNNIPTVAEAISISKNGLTPVSGYSNVYYVPIEEETKLNVELAQSVTDKKVSWSSSNPESVSVTQNGIVVAHKLTNNPIAIKLTYDADENITDVILVKPYLKINQVKLNKNDYYLTAGEDETAEIEIQTIPEEADEVVNIDWVVAFESSSSVEYAYDDPAITKYLNITVIDDRNITVKPVTAEAGNNVFFVRAKVTGISADFTGECRVTVRVPLQSITFSNNNKSNIGLSMNTTPGKPQDETINFNDFYSRNQTDIIRFKVNYRPTNTTDLRSCTWKVISGTDVLTDYDKEGGFRVNKPGNASIQITSDANEEITAQLDLTINCTLESFSIAQPDQVVFLSKNNSGTFTKTIDLTLNKVPSIAEENLNYTSSNEEIATVSKDGKVTFTGKTGTVRISAYTDNRQLSDSVTFYVKIPVSSIVLNRNAVALKIGNTYERTATVNTQESNAQNYIVYSSDNKSVATVDQNGTVTAVGCGKAKISASIDEAYTSSGTSITASYYVYVINPVEDITLYGPDDIMLENGSVRYRYETNPIDTGDTLKAVWSTSNASIATIDQNGILTPHEVGYVTVTVSVSAQNDITSDTFTKSQTLVVNSIYEPAYLKGDLDRNGTVDAADASIALELYKRQQWEPLDIKIGDMDNNNTLDANDASLILELYKTNK